MISLCHGLQALASASLNRAMRALEMQTETSSKLLNVSLFPATGLKVKGESHDSTLAESYIHNSLHQSISPNSQRLFLLNFLHGQEKSFRSFIVICYFLHDHQLSMEGFALVRVRTRLESL